MRKRDYRLRDDVLREVLDTHHRNHRGFAEDLGISPAYFSQLMNRRRRLTPSLRLRLLRHPLIKASGLGESDLWTVTPPTPHASQAAVG